VPSSDSPQPDVVVADYDSGLRLIDTNFTLGRRLLILTQNASEAKIGHALVRGMRGYLLLGCSLEDVLRGIRLVSDGGAQ